MALAFALATITFAYDANGNMTSDGTHTFKYDAENRLTNIVVTGQWKSYFLYDGLGRKRIRREYTWTNSAWTLSGEVRYIYDGFLVLQERNQNNVPRTTYTRGIDLSGSFDGAGGVGGLLGMTRHAQTINYTHYFYHSDALGNITVLQDINEVIQDKYLYDPWGNAFSMSGPLTNISRMRMSGKEWHVQSGLIDFGARSYNPTWQRWMNEDPIGIAGGLNLYRYVGNSPFNSIDPWGLYDEDEELDRRLAIAGSMSAFFGDYAYNEEMQEEFYEGLEEGWENVKDWAKRMAGEAAEDLAWKAACPFLIKPAREPLKKAAKTGLNKLARGPLREHHSWPKYLGGAEKQRLVPLPRSLHYKYHSGLDKILPRQKGTQYYESLSGRARAQVLRDLTDYTKAFDAEHGTELYKAMRKEGFPLP